LTTHRSINLAGYLRRAGGDPALVVAHRLAAALLYYQTGSGGLARTLPALAGELAEFGDDVVPGSFAELAGRVGQVEGVRLARELPAEPSNAGAGLLEQWEPVIAGVVAAAQGDTDAAEALAPMLAELDTASDWAVLAGVLRRVLQGERAGSCSTGWIRPTSRSLPVCLAASVTRPALLAGSNPDRCSCPVLPVVGPVVLRGR
jgi:hypothetical protein